MRKEKSAALPHTAKQQRVFRAQLRLRLAGLVMRYARKNREMAKTLTHKLGGLRIDLADIKLQHDQAMTKLLSEFIADRKK